MNSNIEKMRKMGYSVEVAAKGYEDDGYEHEDGTRSDPQSSPTVYSVNGFGAQLLVNENDESSWRRLADPDAHQLRVDSLRSADPDDNFELPEEEQLSRSLELAVRFGDLSPQEATKIRKSRKGEDT